MTNPYSRAQRGFSLIEVMIAMVLGLLLSVGIVSLFGATSKSNKVQSQLARLQETGRYAVSRITDDLRMTNAQYCSNTGGLAQKQDYEYQDGLRTPLIYTSAFKLPDLNVAIPAMGAGAMPMPSRLFSRGYECDKTNCNPNLPPSVLQKMGTTSGDRAQSADVITLRYLGGKGWSVAENGSTQECDSTGDLSKLSIVPKTGDRDPDTFNSDGLALLADCSNSEIVKLDRSGSVFTPASSGNVLAPKCVSASSDARLFDFRRDFITVTYYLKLVPDPNPQASGRLVSALMRRVNGGDATVGGSEEEIALGVERLDFKYGVEDATGATAYLSAAEVDAGDKASKGGLDCPPPPPGIDTASDSGCLWRAVKSIEVHLLLNTVDDLGLAADEMKFAYSEDGDTAPIAHTTLKSGLPVGKMMRREFTALVALRNYNP